jgi:hypothetical protein
MPRELIGRREAAKANNAKLIGCDASYLGEDEENAAKQTHLLIESRLQILREGEKRNVEVVSSRRECHSRLASLDTCW